MTNPFRRFVALVVLASFIVLHGSFGWQATSAFAQESGGESANESVEAPSNDLGAAEEAAEEPAVEVTAENEAEVTNDVAVEADTGGNDVEAGSATTTDTGASNTSTHALNSLTGIATGDAVAQANVVNVVNVNLVNSEALIGFLSKFSNGDADAIDLRGLGFGYDGSLGCATCETSMSTLAAASSSFASAAVSATNTAEVSSAVVVRANSGGNSAAAHAGDAAVVTGDAYAAASVANVVNSTFVDSKYLMLMLNNFGDWGGDVVLPTAASFERFLQGGASGATTPSTVRVSNDSTVVTETSASADSGGNSATGDRSLVSTGDSVSASTVLNDVNETHIGGSSVVFVFRILGSWSGKTFNLPAGFSVRNTELGVELVSAPLDDEPDAADIARMVGAAGTANATVANEAKVTTSVSATATTGGNSASADAGDAAVVTGDAYAATSVVNTVNTTSIGRNWITAIVNIFGDWSGNISFGQPNLWVGVSAEFENGKNGPGSTAVYRYTLKNNGDAPAHGVRIAHSFGSSLMSFADADGAIEVGDLAPGESREVSARARVAESLPRGETAISSTVTVTQTETDADPADNTDVITVIAANGRGGSGGSDPRDDNPPWLFVSKTNDAAGTVPASSTVGYTITIENRDGDARTAVLVDEIANEAGEVIYSEAWNLGTIRRDETITITYSAFFNASTTPGTYANSARIYSSTGAFAPSDIAVSTVTIGQPANEAGSGSGRDSSGDSMGRSGAEGGNANGAQTALGSAAGPAYPFLADLFAKLSGRKVGVEEGAATTTPFLAAARFGAPGAPAAGGDMSSLAAGVGALDIGGSWLWLIALMIFAAATAWTLRPKGIFERGG